MPSIKQLFRKRFAKAKAEDFDKWKSKHTKDWETFVKMTTQESLSDKDFKWIEKKIPREYQGFVCPSTCATSSDEHRSLEDETSVAGDEVDRTVVYDEVKSKEAAADIQISLAETLQRLKTDVDDDADKFAMAMSAVRAARNDLTDIPDEKKPILKSTKSVNFDDETLRKMIDKRMQELKKMCDKEKIIYKELVHEEAVKEILMKKSEKEIDDEINQIRQFLQGHADRRRDAEQYARDKKKQEEEDAKLEKKRLAQIEADKKEAQRIAEQQRKEQEKKDRELERLKKKATEDERKFDLALEKKLISFQESFLIEHQEKAVKKRIAEIDAEEGARSVDLTIGQLKIKRVLEALHLSLPASITQGLETKPDWLDGLTNIFEKLKPMTIMNAIAHFIVCRSPSEVLLQLGSLLESYGIMWREWATEGRFYVNLLADRISAWNSPTTMVNNANDDEFDDPELGIKSLKVPSHIKPFIKCIGPVVGIALTAVGVSDQAKYVRKVVHVMAESCKDSKTIGGAVTDLYSLTGKAVDYFTDDEELSPQTIICQRVNKMLARLDDTYSKLITQGLAFLDDVGMKQLESDKREIVDLYDTYSKFDGNLAKALPFMRQLTETHSKLKVEYQRLMQLKVERVEPAVLYLFGPSGVGKSKLVQKIIKLLSVMHGKKLIGYTRIQSNYWDGYAQQDVVIYDDFASNPDFNDVSELINLKSSVPMQVEGAAIEAKNVPFTSKYIIICSNSAGVLTYDKSTNPYATDRRRNFLFHVDDPVAVEYRKQHLVDPPLSHYKANFSHLLITRFNPMREGCSYKQANGVYSPSKIAELLYGAHLDYVEKNKIATKNDSDSEIDSDDEQGTFDTTEYIQRATQHQAALATRDIQGADISRFKTNTRDEQKKKTKIPQVQAAAATPNPWLAPHWRNNANERFSYLFIGDAGLGKSKLAADIAESRDDVVVVDEVQTDEDTFSRFLDDVWKAYDGNSTNTFIGTANRFDIDSFIAYTGRDPKAVMRRLRIVRFRLGTYAIKAKRSAGIDFDKDVKYELETCVNHKKEVKKINRAEVFRLITSTDDDKVDTGPKINYDDAAIWTKPVPSSRVYINAAFDRAATLSIGEVIKNIKIVDFTAKERSKMLFAIPKIMSFVKGIQSSKNCFDTINGGGYNFEQRDFAIIFQDKILIAYSVDKKLRLAAVPSEVAKDIPKKYLTDGFTKDCVCKLIDAGLLVLKVVGTGIIGCMAIHSAIQTRQLINGNYENEAIDSDLMAKHRKQLEYCKLCSSFDCHHCRSYQNESVYAAEMYRKTPDVKPVIRTNVKPNTMVSQAKNVMDAITGQGFGDSHAVRQQARNKIFRGPAGTVGVLLDEEVNFVKKDKKPVVDSELVNQSTDAGYKNMSAFDPGAVQLVPLIANNTVFVGELGVIKLRALMICGHIGVTNAHGAPEVGETFKVWKDSNEWTATVVKTIVKLDQTYFRLEKRAPAFRDLRPHIQEKSDGQAYDGTTGILIVVEPARDNVRPTIMTTVQLKDRINISVEGQQRYGIKYTGQRLECGYAPTLSIKGTCGSVVVRLDPQKNRKIISIHSAADKTSGLGVLLFADNFSEFENNNCDILSDIDPQQPIVVLPHQDVLPLKEPLEVEGWKVVGLAHDGDRFHRNFQPMETHYWTSPFSTGANIFEPTVTSPHDTRLEVEYSPYDDAIANYNRQQYSMDEELLDRVVEDVGDYYATLFDSHNCVMKVLTHLEALNGISCYHSSNPLARDTSAGYPFKFWGGIHQKSSFLAFNEKLQIWSYSDSKDGHRLKCAVDALIAHARLGERTAAVEIATSKDETRKIKRVRTEPKTRAFYGAPVDLTIAFRKYFHTWCAAQSDYHEENPIKVGINPYGLGFHNLYRYMASRSDVGFDMDVAGWDYSVPIGVMKKIWRIFNRPYELLDPNYNEEQATIRKNLFATLVCPLILYRDTIVQLPGGHISGEPLTAYLNSVVNHVYYYYIWLKVCRRANRPKLCNHQAFWDNVGIAFYGDDAICTVKYDVQDIFNPEVFVAECAKFGVEVTPADKSGVCRFKPLIELEFLKRHFAFAVDPRGRETSFYCGQLLAESFHKMLDWCYCNKSRRAWIDQDVVKYNMCTIVQVIDVILLEATNHGRSFFEDKKRYLQGKAREYGLPIKHWPTYTECYEMIWVRESSEDTLSQIIKLTDDGLVQSEFQNNFDSMAGKTDAAVVGEKGAPSTTFSNQTSSAGAGGTGMSTLAGGAAPGEMFSHTHSPGMLPFELYEKWVTIGQFTWESNQTSGSVVANFDIGPSGSNVYVKYFTAPYNSWVGGQDYRLILAGTGFNGGKMLIVYIPPNIDYTTFTSLQDFEVFPKLYVDVKTAEPVPVEGHDYRNILFHYTSTAPTSVDGTGGTIVFLVYLPLISSGNTTAAVNCAVQNKPAKDFRVSTMLPLSAAAEAPFNIGRAAALFPETSLEPITGQPVTQIQIFSQSGTPELTQGMYGAVDATGTAMNREFCASDCTAFYCVNTSTPPTGQANNTLYRMNDPTYTPANRPLNYVLGSSWTTTTNNTWVATSTNNDSPGNWVTNMSFHPYTTYQFLNPENNGWPGGSFSIGFITYVHTPQNMVDPTDTPILPVNQNESIVVFQTAIPAFSGAPGSVANIFNCETAEQIVALQGGLLKNVLVEGQAILFEMISKATGQVVNYIKFNFPGYFTAPATSTNVLYDYVDYRFRPIQVMQMTEDIPLTVGVTTAIQMQTMSQSLSKQQLAQITRLLQQQRLRLVEEEEVEEED